MRLIALAAVLVTSIPCAQAQLRSQLQVHSPLPFLASVDQNPNPAWQRHEIGNFGSCGFFSSRGQRWQQTFADGSTLEVRCEREAGGFLPGFHLWFTDTRKVRMEVARCIFGDGLNQGWFYTDAQQNLTRMVWATLDAGPNDGGARRVTDSHRTGAAEPYADATLWVFDPSTRTVEFFNDKFEYLQAGNNPSIPQQPGVALDSFIGKRVPELQESYRKVYSPDGVKSGL